MSAPGSEYIEKIRRRMRLTTKTLDGEISDMIEECREQMVRLGIIRPKAEDETDMLILGAVRLFCDWKFPQYGNTSKDQAKADWEQCIDELRKTTGYAMEVEEIE